MKLGSRYNQHSFAQIPRVNTPRSKFDRSHTIKDTFDFDYLVPFTVQEILPGDTVNLNVKSFARLASQQVPIMDNMFIDYFFFFVPNRLVWNNWERFNGAQDDPGDSTDFLVPHIQAPNPQGFSVGSVYDHVGIPTGVPNIEVSALPFRAMELIWNDWFRDQNLQNSLTVKKDDGPDNWNDYVLHKRAKKHDYATSCLPWPQKGDSISIPLGQRAPVYQETVTASGPVTITQGWDPTTNTEIFGSTYRNGGASPATRTLFFSDTATSPNNISSVGLGSKEQYDLGTIPNAQPPYADLTDATAATINQFRQAIMMQSLLELDARGGTRYTEILRAHFNVVSPDQRLQRPELLSVGTTQISQHPVAQTSESTNDSPQGNLAAFSTSTNLGRNIGFTKSFVEHGYVIGFMQARADVTYQQALDRMWSRKTRWDFFWPKLQELGEQAVLKKEICAIGASSDDEVFGYQERYAEYRYQMSSIRGQFRSSYSESLDVWHLAEEFNTQPSLNSQFIESNTPIQRALVVAEGYPHLKIDMWIDMKHARPMVTYGVPATLGRF